jgi:hypothetical protein
VVFYDISGYVFAANSPIAFFDDDGNIVKLGTSAFKFARKAYKLYQQAEKAGEKFTPDIFKKAGLDEIADLADNLYTVFSDPNVISKVASAAEIITGFNINKNAPKVGVEELSEAVYSGGNMLQAVIVRTKKMPNPWGKLGGPKHKSKINEIMNEIEARGNSIATEIRISIEGGKKKARYMDVAELDKDKNPIKFFQVGRKNKKLDRDGNIVPVKRERNAIDDVNKTGNEVPIEFRSYNE